MSPERTRKNGSLCHSFTQTSRGETESSKPLITLLVPLATSTIHSCLPKVTRLTQTQVWLKGFCYILRHLYHFYHLGNSKSSRSSVPEMKMKTKYISYIISHNITAGHTWKFISTFSPTLPLELFHILCDGSSGTKF